MKKITSYKVAEELANKMIKTGEQIILWDEMDYNRVMEVVADNEGLLEVILSDTVNGNMFRRNMYIGELVRILFENRKDVNRLNDLASL